MLWSQDAQGDLRAWAVGIREILDVDRQLAHRARLRLFESDPSLFGAEIEQKGWLGCSLGKRLRLRFEPDPASHLSLSSLRVTKYIV